MRKIYKLLAVVYLTAFCNISFGQTIWSEDFSGASGTTPPAGWSNTDVSASGLLWDFDNSGGRTINAPMTAPVGIADSDDVCSSGEETDLTSPIFDLSTYTTETIILSFDHYFRGGFGGGYSIEVFDGTDWNQVLSGTTSTTDPQSESIDITVASGLSSATQIKFKWTGSCSWYWILDNIEVTAISCPAPSLVAASNIGLTTADLSWTSGAANFNIEWSTSPFTPGNLEEEGSATSATTSYSFTGLTQGTTYYVSVQADCGVDGVSSWSTPIQFTTSSPGDNCGTALDLATLTSPYVGTTAGFNDSFSQACEPNTASDMIFFIEVPANSELVIGQTSNSYDSKIYVGFGGSCPGATEIACFDDPDVQDVTWFNNTGSSQIVYWIQDGFGTSNGDFELAWTLTAITCPDPTGLTLDNLTSTTADVSWTAGGTETNWNIEWGTPGFVPGTGTQIGADASASEAYSITGLTADTGYDIYVQADCGAVDGTSEWIGPLNVFTGYCIPSSSGSATFIDNFSTTNALVDLSNLATGFAPGGFLDATLISVTALEEGSFDFSAEIVGGTVGFSIWVDWNNDFVFDNATEKVFNTTSYSDGPFSGTITIPVGVTAGDYRMRITTDWNASNPELPCAARTRAEFEDYTITVVSAPTAPPTPVQDAAAPTCDLGTDLTVTGTPDAGISWYWQESATGTATDNLYDGPYTVFANGTYYLRAYDAVYDLWSDASSVTVSNFPLVATAPPAPVAGANPVCLPGTEITMPAPDAGFVYYWQTIENGTSTANNADTPWEITATGTYYVATLETATNCWSETSEITVTVDTYVPEAPSATESVFNICVGEVSQEIEAIAPADGTLAISFGQNLESPGAPVTFPITVPALPNGAIITSAELQLTNVNSINGSWRSEIRVATSGIFTLPATQISTAASSGLVAPDPVINLPAFPTMGGTLNLILSETFNDGGASVIDATFAEVLLVINYSLPASTIEWFDAASAGNSLGTDNPLQAIGTSVLANPATEGTYNFYASSVAGACYSEERALVTINVSAVNVELSAIDVTCNGGNDGSFEVASIECGDEPFTFSVDGGAFGAIPADLTAGTYSIVVRDANNDESSAYTVVIGQPETVTDVVAEAISFEEVELSWNTVGSESQWVVEYGEAGFTPGTGTTVTVSANPATVDGLSENTTYDFYVAPLCAEGFEGEQDGPATATTFCAPIMAQGFCESFDSDSETQDCWTVIDGNDDGAEWLLDETFQPQGGDEHVAIITDFNAGDNDDWLISPQLTLTGNEVLRFYYSVLDATEPNDFEVLLSTTGKNPADFTVSLMDLAVYNNEEYLDTLVDLSAYTGDVYIAWHVPAGGVDGWVLFIDEVCVDICVPTPSEDGAQDVCRLDGIVDLNTVIVPGETTGTWSFEANPGVLNGSELNVSALPTGTYEIMYTVETFCPEEADTAYATINLFGASSAGISGNIETCNYGPLNLFDGLSGTVDLGGTWYGPNGNAIAGNTVNFNGQIAAEYEYIYVTSNEVCPADTATVLVQLQDCANIAENEIEGFALYPNPTADVINIQYTGVNISTDVILSDAKGAIVYSEKVNFNSDENFTIDMSKLVKGIYFLNIYSEDASKVVRVVKN